ncbi:C40 family peptidase [Streptomyces sp. NPDC048172]|uniref:C40 family peptidase n=1 Tax=Streptomyces sp. NPDC048172 TaxID=3365505 RepID=UPI003711DA9D
MSPKAQIPSHRKPRNSKMNTALRAGVTGGVMGTIALTAAATPSFAADNKAPTETMEMPTLSGNLESSATAAADSLQQSALTYELQEAQGSAVTKAKEQAKENKEKAEAKAKAEAKRKAEAARKAAKAAADREDRASRSDSRDSLQNNSAEAPSSSTPSPAKGSGNAATLINFLKGQVGKAYVSGATGPSAYDCSGLTQAAFKTVGVSLPRVSQAQSSTGTEVSLSNLQPGDILYWGGKGSAYHVGVYIGDGKFIGAQNPSKGVVEANMSYDQPTGAVRVL